MPYKHKVVGSNPISTTMKTKVPTMGTFPFPGLSLDSTSAQHNESEGLGRLPKALLGVSLKWYYTLKKPVMRSNTNVKALPNAVTLANTERKPWSMPCATS